MQTITADLRGQGELCVNKNYTQLCTFKRHYWGLKKKLPIFAIWKNRGYIVINEISPTQKEKYPH